MSILTCFGDSSGTSSVRLFGSLADNSSWPLACLSASSFNLFSSASFFKRSSSSAFSIRSLCSEWQVKKKKLNKPLPLHAQFLGVLIQHPTPTPTPPSQKKKKQSKLKKLQICNQCLK